MDFEAPCVLELGTFPMDIYLSRGKEGRPKMPGINHYHLECCIEARVLKITLSGNTHRTNWEVLLSQTLASMDKKELRAISAASPNGAGRRSSGQSGGRCRRRGC